MKRVITVFDKECLNALIHRLTGNFGRTSPELQKLQEVLDSAEVASQVPDDVITLDSVAVLRSALLGKQRIYSPVLPALADFQRHRVSVLAPLGMSMLGRRVGDTFVILAPGGKRTVSVEKILYRLDRSDEQINTRNENRAGHGNSDNRISKHKIASSA